MSLLGRPKPGVTRETILGVLKEIVDPHLQKDIVTLDLVRELEIQDGKVSFTLAFTTHPAPVKVELHAKARRAVAQLAGVTEVKVKMGASPQAARPQAAPHAQHAPPANLIPDVKHTIAVSSGKGGVGKSTVAVNLSLALRQSGATVGLVDVDVYGPDIPLMMGARGKPGMFDNRIIPVEAHGVKLISIGFFVPEGEAIVWRGPMIDSAVKQFLKDVLWGELDYLVFDMPPGTGDAQLSLSQVIPLSGAVIVTTPQDVALLDVRKAIAMFRKMNVPILGVVENMSAFACPHCGEGISVFGEGGGRRVADEFGVPLLAKIPLDPETRKGGDAGLPILVGLPDSEQAEAFRRLAAVVVSRIEAMETRLPTIG